MRPSIRLRLVAAFAATLAVVLVVVGTLVLTQFRSERDRTIATELRARARSVATAGPSATKAVLVGLLGTSDEHFGQVLDEQGHVIASSRLLPSRPMADPTPVSLQTRTVQTRLERRWVRIDVTRSGSRIIAVATALDDRNDAVNQLAVLLWTGGAAALAAASLLAWILAGAALWPVERMRAQAAQYTATDLSGRLPVHAANDELHRLAETLNEMLGRIQLHVDEQRSFIDKASHELRTPLANLSMELELALRRERSPNELQAALRSATQESSRLNRLASDLLLLSKVSDPQRPVIRHPVDLGALVRETTATFRARAQAEGVTVTDTVAAIEPVLADPVGIRQALTNLLDNSLRFTPAGGTITAELTATPDAVTLAVRDDGPGFPPEVREHAFEPFAHGRGPRSPDAGAGQGGRTTIRQFIARSAMVKIIRVIN